MHKALHSRDVVDKVYVCRREGRKGFANIEDSVNASIQLLEDYIEKWGRRLITDTKNNTNDTWTSGTTMTRKQKWEEKQHCWRFKRLTGDTTHKKMWTWQGKTNPKRKTESLLVAPQNNALRTKHIKARIDKTQQNSKSCLCCLVWFLCLMAYQLL